MASENNTQRMVVLLGSVRKQMNGAVLDTMRYYGREYGVNYGVALHTLREMARAEVRDTAFARYLYMQQVRELRIMALWITADFATSDIGFWADGVINSEVAAEVAMALAACGDTSQTEYFARWSGEDRELVVYAALMSLSHGLRVEPRKAVTAVAAAIARFADSALIAQAAVAALAALKNENRALTVSMLGSLPDTVTARKVRDEMQWRLEY